jgi:hypothetical protein
MLQWLLPRRLKFFGLCRSSLRGVFDRTAHAGIFHPLGGLLLAVSERSLVTAGAKRVRIRQRSAWLVPSPIY